MKMVDLRNFNKFPNLDYNEPIVMGRMETANNAGINLIVIIWETNDVAGLKDAAEKLKCLSEAKSMSILWTR